MDSLFWFTLTTANGLLFDCLNPFVRSFSDDFLIQCDPSGRRIFFDLLYGEIYGKKFKSYNTYIDIKAEYQKFTILNSEEIERSEYLVL